MTKISYKDLPRFTECKSHGIAVPWTSIESTLVDYNVDMDPDFQRGHVWTRKQQIAYVEFRLSGGLTGRDLYFNATSPEAPTLLVDGKQRLTAVMAFLNGDFPVFGYFRHEIADFPRLDAEVLFFWHVNNLPTRADVLRWYLEMNSGGVVHSPEERGGWFSIASRSWQITEQGILNVPEVRNYGNWMLKPKKKRHGDHRQKFRESLAAQRKRRLAGPKPRPHWLDVGREVS